MSLPAQASPPSIALSAAGPGEVPGADVVALPVLGRDAGDGSPGLGPGAAEFLDRTGLDAFALMEAHGFTGTAGEVLAHDLTARPGLSRRSTKEGPRLLLLLGLGEQTPAQMRRAGAALARRTRAWQTVTTSATALADDVGLRAFAEGLVLGSFSFHWRSTGPAEPPVRRVVLAGVPDATARHTALERALAVAGAGWLSRTLALTPANEKNPPWLAEQAGRIASEHGLDLEVWDEAALARDGFGGILGVGQASASPPRLIRLGYTPRRSSRRTPHVVLVGKGITFDTGGLSLKPAEAMATMKRDMTGGGVVMAVLGALGAVDCPVRVTGLVASAENAVGGNALRPGDVLRHYGGRTSEVTNTDAEGRLVMADALAYAVAELDPTVVVDVATLTGAVKVALGLRTGGYFATDDALAGLLRVAGEAAGEPLWRLPLAAEYEDRLHSDVADADNAPGGPGAITAALFLQHFVGAVPWAHLDVASVGDSPVDAYEWTQGATGFGARVLLHWLELRDPLEGVRR